MDTFSELIGDRCSCERLMMSRQDILRSKNFYYACVSFVDYQVGRIIAALKEKGMYDDTLILFSSDHGDMMGDYNAIGKRTMVDSSCHVPLMIHYPGLSHEVRTQPCSLVDIAPTVLHYAGASFTPEEFDGVDLFGQSGRTYVYSQHGCGSGGTYMVTDGQNKLVYSAARNKYYFFDQIPETRNVYDDVNPKVQEMREKLDAYRMSDVNKAKESKTYEQVTKTHPHYPGRMDHALLHDAELAAIPEEYHIDLD